MGANCYKSIINCPFKLFSLYQRDLLVSNFISVSKYLGIIVKRLLGIDQFVIARIQKYPQNLTKRLRSVFFRIYLAFLAIVCF